MCACTTWDQTGDKRHTHLNWSAQTALLTHTETKVLSGYIKLAADKTDIENSKWHATCVCVCVCVCCVCACVECMWGSFRQVCSRGCCLTSCCHGNQEAVSLAQQVLIEITREAERRRIPTYTTLPLLSPLLSLPPLSLDSPSFSLPFCLSIQTPCFICRFVVLFWQCASSCISSLLSFTPYFHHQV